MNFANDNQRREPIALGTTPGLAALSENLVTKSSPQTVK